MQETRARVIEAAHAVFSEPEFQRASLDDVAKRAGVARATVYQQFGSRLGVLREVLDDRALRAGIFELHHIREEPDPVKALRMYVEALHAFWSSDYVLFRNFNGLAAIDPEVGAVLEGYVQRRREFIAGIVRRLATAELLSPAFTQKHAVEVVWMLTSLGTYDQLHRRSRLSARTTKAVLLELVSSVLVPDAR